MVGRSLRIDPIARDDIAEEDGRLVIPSSGHTLTDEVVQELRDSGRR